MSSSALSIVIPAYNESARIGKTLRELVAYLEQQPGGGEVIVVDDGSKDDTIRVAEGVFAEHSRRGVEGRVIRVQPNRGRVTPCARACSPRATPSPPSSTQT